MADSKGRRVVVAAEDSKIHVLDLVDRTDTTIFISADYTARVDEVGSVVLQRQPVEAEDA